MPHDPQSLVIGLRRKPDTIDYSYNDRSEVTGAVAHTDNEYDFHYAYDPIGNRTTSGTTNEPAQRVYSEHETLPDGETNNLNQYKLIRESIHGTIFLSYDDDGNMTLMPSSDRDWELKWNAENRLVEAKSADTRLEFTYDYQGRRIRKKVSTGGEGNWALDSHEKFIYDGWNLIAVLDAADSNSVVKTYTWGLDLSQSLQGAGGVGGLLAVTEHDPAGDENYHPTYDANGNVSEYIDDTGTVVAHYEYCPFSQLTVASGAKADDFAHRFSTKYLDSETELYYYGYRYYSAVLGRWISRDPIGEQGGLNLYGFVGNGPVNAWDVLGLKSYPASRFGLKDNCWDCKVNEYQIWQVLGEISLSSAAPKYKEISGTRTVSLNISSIKTRNDGSVAGVDSAGLLARTTVDITYTWNNAIGTYKYYEVVYCYPKFPLSLIFSARRFEGDLLDKRRTRIAVSDTKTFGLGTSVFPISGEIANALARDGLDGIPSSALPDWSGNIDDMKKRNIKDEKKNC